MAEGRRRRQIPGQRPLDIQQIPHRRHGFCALWRAILRRIAADRKRYALRMLGGAYTYARVPLGFQIQDWLDLARNPYDKIGHLFQGLVPALAAREILLRGGFVSGPRMRAFLVVCVVLAISAFYELIEWWAALAMGQGADEFLGTQGDMWDTQSDMFCALLGAIAAQVLFGRTQDRQVAALEAQAAAPVRP